MFWAPATFLGWASEFISSISPLFKCTQAVYFRLPKNEAFWRLANYTKFFVQRHPFERLTSAHNSKFTDRTPQNEYKKYTGVRAARILLPKVVGGIYLRFLLCFCLFLVLTWMLWSFYVSSLKFCVLSLCSMQCCLQNGFYGLIEF